MRRRRWQVVVLVAAGLASAGLAWAAGGGSNIVGPKTRIQPTGRKLNPVGALTKLGNFPTGGALTPNGRFLWTLSTGRGRNDVRIVQVAKTRCGKKGKKAKKCNRRAGRKVGNVVQTIQFPGL